jgi:protoporphyrinogen oxidase
MNIGIIGAGATGLVVAHEFAKKNHKVTVIEKNDKKAGLVGSLKIGNKYIESFYHHIFTNDSYIIDLINELDLSDKLGWYTPKSGIYSSQKLYPFSTGLDFLKFNEMNLLDRFTLGLLIYRSKFIKDWSYLENISAKEWILKNSGKSSWEKLWEPLIISKFDKDAEKIPAVWLWNKFKLRGSTRDSNVGKEMFGYVDGSFGIIYEELGKRIINLGGDIKTSCNVEKISPNKNNTIDIDIGNNILNFDKVLFTPSPEILTYMNIDLPNDYKSKLKSIKYKSNICMILELKKQIGPYYWTTIAEKNYPFVAIIEHTNLVPKEWYNGNIVYLSRYIDSSDELFKSDDKTITKLFLDNFKKIYPNFNENLLKNIIISRAKYAQPVVTKNYSEKKIEYETPIKNFYIANMSQIYPEDRGQNYSVKLGKEVTELMLK